MKKIKLKNISSFLTQKNIKPSFQRIKILEYILNKENHPTADKIYAYLVKKIPTLSKSTIYNTLELFKENNIVISFQIKNNINHWDGNTNFHAHFYCEKCKLIYDFSIDKLKVNLNKNFVIKNKNLLYSGLCQNCSDRIS